MRFTILSIVAAACLIAGTQAAPPVSPSEISGADNTAQTSGQGNAFTNVVKGLPDRQTATNAANPATDLVKGANVASLANTADITGGHLPFSKRGEKDGEGETSKGDDEGPEEGAQQKQGQGQSPKDKIGGTEEAATGIAKAALAQVEQAAGSNPALSNANIAGKVDPAFATVNQAAGGAVSQVSGAAQGTGIPDAAKLAAV